MTQIDEMLRDTATTVAVVGATDTPDKYGGRVYRDLKAKGFRVIPVHPRADTVDGDAAFPALDDLPVPPDITVLVVPAPVGRDVIENASAPGFVWMQPGSSDDDLLAHLEGRDLDHRSGACIMVATSGVRAGGQSG